ncbi:MAG TPA: hypothetical protein VHA33_05135 [Candidatus Angelobacter sp.]|jgi:hypothetical protein|nr:hypothetical protein [Candidatus Angelobacter sp.]
MLPGLWISPLLAPLPLLETVDKKERSQIVKTGFQKRRFRLVVSSGMPLKMQPRTALRSLGNTFNADAYFHVIGFTSKINKDLFRACQPKRTDDLHPWRTGRSVGTRGKLKIRNLPMLLPADWTQKFTPPPPSETAGHPDSLPHSGNRIDES